jgi:two-component system LytT family response regulator
MKKIRTIVADDEPLARARLLNLLKRYDFVTIVGECKNGRETLQQIETYQPDLVFLDIQMPDFNGFEVLSKTVEPLPFIIFVTAYDQYALKAFDVHAVDYLLKPYDDERFGQALEHARRQIAVREKAFLHQKMVQMLDSYQQPIAGNSPQTIEVKDRGRSHHVPLQDIYYFEAEGNYLHLHLRERNYLIRQTMQGIEEIIAPEHFLRIHRSVLVNVHYVEKVWYEGNSQYRFTLKNDKQLSSGRSYREAIEQYLADRELWGQIDKS